MGPVYEGLTTSSPLFFVDRGCLFGTLATESAVYRLSSSHVHVLEFEIMPARTLSFSTLLVLTTVLERIV